MDWYAVVLSPLLALALVAILGFAGCDRVLGLEPVSDNSLVIEARVPSTISVDRAVLQWKRPGSTVMETATMLSAGDDGAGNTVYSYPVSTPGGGTWTAQCRLDVHVGTDQASDTGSGMFMIDFATIAHWDAIFDTRGAPPTMFRVVFSGAVGE